MTNLPVGKPTPEIQAAELDYWVVRGVRDWHLNRSRPPFRFDNISYDATEILDVGSGPISVFEDVAPPLARITAYDTLATEYNRIAPDKKYPITDTLPEHQYDLVTLFNCLDHMNDPGELLEALRTRLSNRGQLWVWVHIDRPFSPKEHPQDFRFWQLVSLVHDRFDILKCGLTRHGKLYPYVWWCIAGVRRETPGRAAWKVYHTMRCAVTFARFHARRAVVKAGRIMRAAVRRE